MFSSQFHHRSYYRCMWARCFFGLSLMFGWVPPTSQQKPKKTRTCFAIKSRNYSDGRSNELFSWTDAAILDKYKNTTTSSLGPCRLASVFTCSVGVNQGVLLSTPWRSQFTVGSSSSSNTECLFPSSAHHYNVVEHGAQYNQPAFQFPCSPEGLAGL